MRLHTRPLKETMNSLSTRRVEASPLRRTVGILLRVLIGAALFYAGFSKAVSPVQEFEAGIAAYHVMPAAAIPIIARVWPWLELLVGTYIFFGYFTRLSAVLATGMFGVFLGVILSAMVRGIDPVSCGCFGLGFKFTIHKMAFFDSFFFILCLGLVYLAKTPLPPSADTWAE